MEKYLYSNRYRFKRAIKRLPDLVAYWPMDELNASTLRNEAPATKGSLDGTINGVTPGVATGFGRGFSFGGDDYISIADNDLIEGLDAATVFYMVKRGTVSAFEKLFFKNGVFDMGINNSGQAFGEFNGVGNPEIWGTNEIDDDELHFLALSYDGSQIIAYVDGVAIETLGSLSGSLGTSTGPLEIGRHANNQNEYYNGLLQHAGIMSRAIEQSELDELLRIARVI